MTFAKKDTVRLVAYGAAILLLILGVLLSGRGAGAAELSPLVSADLGKLEAIELVGATSSVDFRKVEGGWKLSSDGQTWLPARQSRVENMLSELESANILRVASSNADQAASFGLPAPAPAPALAGSVADGAPATGSIKLVFPGDARVSYQIGQATSLGGEYFARIAGESRIIVVPSSLAFALGQDAAYWVELRLWPERPQATSMSKVIVESSAQTLQFQRAGEDQAWQDAQGQPASNFENQLRTVLDWELADRFATASPEAALASSSPVLLSIQLSGTDGGSSSIALAQSSLEGRYALIFTRDSGELLVGTILQARVASFLEGLGGGFL